jgi:Secretion system C-terminal sorting domain/Polysaccharide deacetylase/PA14 domain
MNNWYSLPFKAILNILPLWATFVQAQTPTVSYATWKDNARAAYTIVHDDFGDVTTLGITRYADTIAYNRGIKFSFGAITKACDDKDWSDARRLMGHGHEIINHSHSHKCSYQSGSCESYNIYSPSDFSVELDGSTALIERNVGERPRFWIHPYDLSTPQVLDRLRNLGYLGTRSGRRSTLNPSNFNDFFRINFHVFEPGFNLNALNQTVRDAVSAGSYAMRELHGVGDLSWGVVSVSDYRSHLNFVKQQINAGNLWVATASEAITYRMQKDVYYPSVAYSSSAKTLTVNFKGASSVQPSLFKTPVTINIQLNGLALGNPLTVKQGGQTLSAKVSSSRITVNAYPYKGNIVISAPNSGNSLGCEPNCPPPPPSTCDADGKFKAEIWKNLTATSSLSDLTNAPTLTEFIGTGDFSRGDIGSDNYGERLSAYLKPSESGDYVFAVSGDADVALYVSTSSDPARKSKIAGFTGSTASYQWTKYTGQKSQPIALKANETYYIEVLHLATTGQSHCTLGWQKVGNQSFMAIPSEYLSSKSCASTTSQPLFTLNGTRTGQTALLNWSTNQVDENTPYIVERLESNGRFSEIGTAQNIQFADETPINGINIYRIRYTDAYGQTRHSEPVQLNFTENPALYLAPNPATNEVSVDLREWNQATVTVYVYDVRGAEVQRVMTTASDTPYQLDLNRIETGQYMIRVQSADGRAAAQRLMIIKE